MLSRYVIGVPAVVWWILNTPTNQVKIANIFMSLQTERDGAGEAEKAKKRHKKARASLMGHIPQPNLGTEHTAGSLDDDTLRFHKNFSFLFLGYHLVCLHALELLYIIRYVINVHTSCSNLFGCMCMRLSCVRV